MSEEKPRKRAGSLMWRLTLQEVWRSVRLLLFIDLVIVCIAVGSLFAMAEYRAYQLMDMPKERLYELAQNRQSPGFYTLSVRLEHPKGWKPPVVAEELPVPLDTTRFFTRGFRSESFWHELDRLQYVIVLSPTQNEYVHVSFDFGFAVRVGKYILTGMIGLELIILLFNVFRVRNSVRRTLFPIQELAYTAQTITAPASTPTAIPLSGTIDALNTITAKHLDTRISIQDEREELQGLAQAINDMLDRLDAAYRSQLRFVSDASHELRTPIAVIQGYAALLNRWGKDDPEALAESIEAIRAEAANMQTLVEQLLFLARGDSNAIPLNINPVDLSALADEVLRETQLINKTHTLVGQLPSVPIVYADAQLLKQALRILVDNAVKYSHDGGRITLSTQVRPEEICLSVSDEGVGIPEEEVGRVFDRFFRADQSRTRKTGGTGLGLSIAKWIVDRHGGYVELISRENIGTKVTIVLPQAHDEATVGLQ